MKQFVCDNLCDTCLASGVCSIKRPAPRKTFDEILAEPALYNACDACAASGICVMESEYRGLMEDIAQGPRKGANNAFVVIVRCKRSIPDRRPKGKK